MRRYKCTFVVTTPDHILQQHQFCDKEFKKSGQNKPDTCMLIYTTYIILHQTASRTVGGDIYITSKLGLV